MTIRIDRPPAMFNRFLPALALFAPIFTGSMLATPAQSASKSFAIAAEDAPRAPAFTHTKAEDWLNSKPLTWNDLRGQVVLIDVWAFACWNCYRSIPWLNSLKQKFPAEDFTIIGVHTPELPQERVLAKLKAKLIEFELTSPVMVDNDYSYWNALSNQYWPAFYLVDRQGRVRGRYIGETHAGDQNARRMEAAIAALLKEPAAP